MLEVKNTRNHTIQVLKTIDGKFPHTGFENILVTDGELMLIEHNHGTTPNKAGEICKFPYGLNIAGKDDMGYPVIKPMVISLTEKIEVGDWFYWEKYNMVEQATKHDKNHDCFKIVALPEHFSPQQLQQLTTGELKTGKCIVECEKYYAFDSHPEEYVYQIKLNPYVSIHPTEQKMYTRDEVKAIALKAWNPQLDDGDFERWFELNVK